jgi:hypothetical protein
MTRNTETKIPNAVQIVTEANAAIDEAVKLFPGAEMYQETIADRESALSYLLRSVYVAGMTAEAIRRHEKRASAIRGKS